MKVTQPQKFKSAITTPFKRTESVHSVPLYNTESHQSLYLEETLT